MIRVRRVYEAPRGEDGCRILVDGIWPRGLSKERAAVDIWLREVAPTSGLRKWFGHRTERWAEFRERYHRELDRLAGPIETIRSRSREGTVTLLFAARDPDRNNAIALRDYLAHPGSSGEHPAQPLARME